MFSFIQLKWLFRFGICVPSTCSKSDVSKGLWAISEEAQPDGEMAWFFAALACKAHGDSVTLDGWDIFYMCVVVANQWRCPLTYLMNRFSFPVC